METYLPLNVIGDAGRKEMRLGNLSVRDRVFSMKILFGMPSPTSWGGPAACEPPFVDAIATLGVDAATETYVYGDKERATSTLGRAVRVLRTALKMRRRLADRDFDIIHLNTAFDKRTILRDAVSIFLMKPGKAKIFLKIHGSSANRIDPNSVLYGRLIAYIDRHVAGYGVFSEEERESFDAHGIARSKFFLVKNVVELSAAAESERHASTDGLQLVFASRFVETKGLVETIEAVALAREDGCDVELTAMGDGPFRDEAERSTERLRAREFVHFTGYVTEEEVEQRMLAGDVFVFPTRHDEGFPIALFKAAIAGMAIVTTLVRAAAVYFEDGVNCLFSTVAPRDIADKIELLAADPQLRKQMATANRQFKVMLSPPNIAREYLAIYERMLEPRA